MPEGQWRVAFAEISEHGLDKARQDRRNTEEQGDNTQENVHTYTTARN